MNVDDFTVTHEGLYRPIGNKEDGLQECILTREEFITCYNAWIKEKEDAE